MGGVWYQVANKEAPIAEFIHEEDRDAFFEKKKKEAKLTGEKFDLVKVDEHC